ncbi:MAG: hypothetical protein [Allistipes phage R001]|nr:MAG: hypothetical protein [Allistipes phage R001]
MKFSSFAEIASVNTSEATTAQAAFRKQLLLNHSNQIFHLGKRPIAHGFVAVGYGCRTGGDGLLERGILFDCKRHGSVTICNEFMRGVLHSQYHAKRFTEFSVNLF